MFCCNICYAEQMNSVLSGSVSKINFPIKNKLYHEGDIIVMIDGIVGEFATIRAKYDCYVNDIYIKVGDNVKSGDILVDVIKK